MWNERDPQAHHAMLAAIISFALLFIAVNMRRFFQRRHRR